MDEVTPPAKTDLPERVLVVHDETVAHQNDDEGRSYQELGGSASLNQKGNGAGYHVSGFLSEDVGRMTITKEQWARTWRRCPTTRRAIECLRLRSSTSRMGRTGTSTPT